MGEAAGGEAPIEVCLLADRPELIDQLVEGYERWSPDWYGPGGSGDARADLTARARRGGLPCGIVAASGALAVGACALAAESITSAMEVHAWLVGLWVRPSHRGCGLAGRLLKAAEAQAMALGLEEVRAGTMATGVFERAGWRHHASAEHHGRPIELFYVRPPARRSSLTRP